MSTRSAIIEKTEKGYRGIYCHSDGYPEGVGATLMTHYTDPSKVHALLDLGDLSFLGESLDSDSTFAYMRDRGEDGCEAFEGKTVAGIRRRIDHEYAYVFEDGKWTIIKKGSR